MTRLPILVALTGLLGLPVTGSPAARIAAQTAARPAAPPTGARAEFLTMFARGYFPGRTGQLLIVPREGTILTRDEPGARFMHGSPWPYDRRLPLLFAGVGVTPGVYTGVAVQQDIAVTIAAALGMSMPRTATGRVLPGVAAAASPPRAVLLVVLDGMRADYFDRHAGALPILSALRKNGAWFANAQANYLPTNTGAAHATIATGAEPRVHGVTGNNLYDRARRARQDLLAGWQPRDLMALTIADVWQLSTAGRGKVIAQGSSVPAGAALAGHGACQVGGTAVVHAGYDLTAGAWRTNPECFTLPKELVGSSVRDVWPADGLWMGHRVDGPSEIRYSALFPRFEADAFIRLIETQPIGDDAVTDLLLLNFKAADYVGHKHGPDSPELAATLAAIDREFGRIVAAIEARVGRDYLVAVTADHGMPAEPKMPGGRRFAPGVIGALHARFDHDERLVPYYEPENAQIFVDADRRAALGLSLAEMAAFLEAQPFIEAAFTEDEVRQAAARLP